MSKFFTLWILLLFLFITHSHSATLTERIIIDQFGYRPEARKIAVISDPIFGFNRGFNFTPGNEYQIRSTADSSVVFTGIPSPWNGGQIHDQSGDRVWWFDFSELKAIGEYYIYDPENDSRSFSFEISPHVYNIALKHALRMFYYQRCGIGKVEPYAQPKWADRKPCHLLDEKCIDPVTGKERDVSGGWHDAGDYNKYVDYANGCVHDLLFAYRHNPTVFGDDNDIPESGNGIPDIIDELKWELDWLKKMWNPDGSVLQRVHISGAKSPPSADVVLRNINPPIPKTSAVLAGEFAHAYMVFKRFPELEDYAKDLLDKAIVCWRWMERNAANFEYNEKSLQICSAAFLYEATGESKYRNFFENNYTKLHPIEWSHWYAFESYTCSVLLHYANLLGASPIVSNAIFESYTKSVQSKDELLPAFRNQRDAYMAYLEDGSYTWGSNSVKSANGMLIYHIYFYRNASPDAVDAAEGYIHYIHGVNPLSMVYLSNMYEFGAEKCANEMYHHWFKDGSEYDNALTSPKGPAPGFVPGGANNRFKPDDSYSGPPLEPPMNQPTQKSYRDWNTTWPQDSWEVTEPALSYQGAYIRLLSKFASDGKSIPNEPAKPGSGSLIVFPNPSSGSITINYSSTFPCDMAIFDVLGRQVYSQTLHENNTTIDLPQLSNGIYIARVKSGGDVYVVKFTQLK
ncbi:glycoside hydrolase family 9 protein [candidate division KSB1 bacterium]|nr:glycoside hydrolase family 9 protein [candidate division KSB1 bacterium]